ncbi:unnamed protein product [Urochloa decumbens]|uniref:Uncharacterized protein n=1 Tax=Urochloa decumbens TaxID=240449 RepID=A0ABC9DKC6_9POAL
MAPSFGRSISFPARSSKPRAAAYHVRSISLPCRSHPLLAHLHTHTAAARTWAAAAEPTTSSPSSGLAHIHALLAAVAEVLLLPEAQAAVRSAASDRLLDAFLLLADAHRGFQDALLNLKRDAADVRAALRRRDAAARLVTAARSQRRTDKELARLAAAASSAVVAGNKCARLGLAATAEEAEMAAALMDAAAASATASAAVFSALASVSTAASSSKKTASSTFAAFAKKATTTMEAADLAPEKLDELEHCIDECETGSEMVFRSIVRTRVSLLNIRTPAI